MASDLETIKELEKETGIKLKELKGKVRYGTKAYKTDSNQNVTGLYLNDAKLKEFPSIILQLKNLTELYLYDNQLSTLPGEISQLKNLTNLYLFDNQLTRLPAEISHLKKLTALYLSYNKLLRALDIGSGFGFFSQAALQEGFEVKAVNPGMWENNIFKELNKFSPIQTFFENVDFKEESFDLVILSQVLEHVERPFEFLVKIKKVLKQSGVLTIAVPNVYSFLVKILKDKENGCFWVPEHLTYFSEKGLKKILLRAGFIIVRNIFVSQYPNTNLLLVIMRSHMKADYILLQFWRIL